MRPGLVIQNDVANSVQAYPVTIVCAVSSKLKGHPSMVRVAPSQKNGLTQVSEVNTAQIITVQKDRLGRLLGRLSGAEMSQVEEKLAYMLGIPLPPEPSPQGRGLKHRPHNRRPFLRERPRRHGTARASVPVGGVSDVPLLAVQVGVDPRAVRVADELQGIVCRLPVTLPVVPQSFQGRAEAGRRRGLSE